MAEQQKLDLKQRTAVMAAIDAERQRTAALDDALIFDRDSIREHLKPYYEQLGGNPTDDEMNAGIDLWIDQQYRFQPAKPGLGTTLAKAFVDRSHIWRAYVRPAITFATIGALAFGAITAVRYAAAARHETNIEATIAATYVRAEDALQNAITGLEQSPLISSLPPVEADQVRSELSFARQERAAAMDALRPYVPETKDLVTQANMEDASRGAEASRVRLTSADSSLALARAILDNQEHLRDAERNIETLMRDVRTSNPPDNLSAQAEQAYRLGRASLESRDAAGAARYQQEIAQVRTDIAQLRQFGPEELRLYTAARATAAEPAAVHIADSLHAIALTQLRAANISGLRPALNALRSLDSVLSTEYTLRIRQGCSSDIEYCSGGWRQWHPAGGGLGDRTYYVVVQAVRTDGSLIPMRIRNQEDGRVSEVTHWGEQVSLDVLNAVRADKEQDGMIQNDVFGRKARGFLEPQTNYPRRGQFTGWR